MLTLTGKAAGARITYTIGVTNAGPDPASSVKVVDTLPAGATFLSASGTDWSCVNASGTVTCDRTAGNLAPGSAPNITIQIQAPVGPTTLTNNATVSSRAVPIIIQRNSRGLTRTQA